MYVSATYARLMAITEDTMMNISLTGCLNPCHYWTYAVTTNLFSSRVARSLSGSTTPYTVMWFTYLSNMVEEHEEYEVYDFSGIVAALGGSLGLFLGFSCFSCLWAVCDSVANSKKMRRMKVLP